MRLASDVIPSAPLAKPELNEPGNTSPQDRHDSAGAGADGHLAKPINAASLIGALQDALLQGARNSVAA